VNAMHSGRSPYLTYFETNYAYGNMHYVEIPTVGRSTSLGYKHLFKLVNDQKMET